MILTIKSLTPTDIQKFMVLWGRLKGSKVNSEDFKYVPQEEDYVETCVVPK